MTERDVFERRLHAALLHHVALGPTDFDASAFARLVAEREPRRRGFAAVLGRRPAGVPRAAWVLLLVGLLLAVAIAGVLLVGSPLERRLPAVVPLVGSVACPPGSNPDAPGPADQARPPRGAVTAVAFDGRAGRLVAVAGTESGVETWTFDVCANRWTVMRPSQELPAKTDGLVYDVDSDLTVTISSNHVWGYDLVTDAWTEGQGVTPTGARLLFHDPVSGLVVAIAEDGDEGTPGPELWTYSVETDTWNLIHQADGPDIQPRQYAYDASVDRLIAYSPEGTWLFDLRTGRWSESSAVSPAFSYGWWGIQPAIAYDEAAGRTVLAGQGRSVAYDAAMDRWETLFETPSTGEPGACGTRPECRTGSSLVYDPVNRRLVAFGGSVATTCTWHEPGDIQAFDFVNRSWMLVAPQSPAPLLRDLSAEGAPAEGAAGRSPWIHAKQVTLHGGSFFTRIPGVADQPWVNTPPAVAASVADGLFLPDCQLWTDGAVWWEETVADASSRAWIEIDLGGTFVLDAAVVQADVNDEYLLSYRDPETAGWVPLWTIPLGEAGGLATRPLQEDASVRWPLARPVRTSALRFEATSGDAQYSVSEIAVFGQPAP